MKTSKLFLRFLAVGGLILVLMVPLEMIGGTIEDRQQYRAQASDRVAQSMAGPQQLIGPLRVVPWIDTYEVTELDAAGQPEVRLRTNQGYEVQAPESLQVQGSLRPDTRRIGLYSVRIFEWQAQLQTSFAAKELPLVARRVYGKPLLVVGLADVRGIVGTPKLMLDGKPLRLQSGTAAFSDRMNGVHAALPITAGEALPASRMIVELKLMGTQSLDIAPIADSNHIALQSSWPHPLFSGRFLPNDRQISAKGFRANWKISSLASAAQSQLAKSTGPLTRTTPTPSPTGEAGQSASSIDSVQVSLVDPVDVYTQADRASKYGILFVLLTFVGFVLFELIKRLSIHPVQYLLVGLALAIFFLLLLSLSEHIAFLKAYLIAAIACIGLQFVYLSGVLKSWLRAGGFATMLTTLYGVLYGLLLSEDNALLMGSLLLFAILAAIMWVTRKVDWYDVSTSLR